MAILNKRISSVTLPELQNNARLGSIIRDVASAPATENAMYRTINPSASTNQTPAPAYVSQLTSAMREMQPQNYTSMVAPTRSNDVSLMSSQMPDMSGVPNISKGPITSITQPGDTARQKIGSTTSTSGGIPSAVINALAGAVMGLGAQKIINSGNKSTTGSNTSGTQKPPVTSTVSTLPKWAEGNPTITDNKNGTYTQKTDDGSTLLLDKDGKIISTTDSNGDIVDKNGSTVHDNGNGTHTIIARDGTTTVVNDEGTVVVDPHKDDYTEYPVKDTIIKDPINDYPVNDGSDFSPVMDEPAGKRGGLAVMMKNGGVAHFKDGGVTQDNGNGTSTTTYPDKTTVTKDDQGNVIRQTDASGNILSGDTLIDPVQSILDLLKTSGGAAGAGGVLAALLSSTGGNTNNVNTGLDMSTYGLLNPRTTNFGMGPAKYVPYSDYSARNGYKPNAELFHNLNAPASNPVNQGDYKPPYVTNRPGTTNNMTSNIDINAIIAQIVKAIQNKQLLQNVNQASGTPTAGNPVLKQVSNAPAVSNAVTNTTVTNQPTNTAAANLAAAAAGTLPPGVGVNSYGQTGTPGTVVPSAGGFAGIQNTVQDPVAYAKMVADKKAQDAAEQAKLDAYHISPDSPLYKYVQNPSLIPHKYGQTDAQAVAEIKKQDYDNSLTMAYRTALSNMGYGDGFFQEGGQLYDADHNLIPPKANEVSNTLTDPKTGQPRYETKPEEEARLKGVQTYLQSQGNVINPDQPWNIAATDDKIKAAQNALANLHANPGPDPQATLNNFLKTTTFTPDDLYKASNGLWSVEDLGKLMAGNTNQPKPEVGGVDKITRSRAQGFTASDMPADVPVDTGAPSGGLNALAGQISTPMTGVIDGGIKKAGTNDFDPNSGYQNPGSSIAQMQNDLYPPKQPTSYGGNDGIYGPGGMFPLYPPEYQQPIGDPGPPEYIVDPERLDPVPNEQPQFNGGYPIEQQINSAFNFDDSGYPVEEPQFNGGYPVQDQYAQVSSGPMIDEIQAMIDAQNAYSSSGGAKRGGAIHKATGGLTHYTYGKPADVLENLGLRGQQMAQGGLPHVSNVPIVQGRMDFRQGSAVHGKGDGQSDDIPAMLADGEYVIDADTVAQIGNGSTKAGAQALDKFRESIRAHKRSAPINKIPPKTKALTSYLKVK